MAGFKMHISTSTVVGIGYGVAGHLAWDMPLPVAMISGGLCSIAGILPDLDSDSGKPVRELTAFSAAVIPMLMMERLRAMGMSAESMVLAGGCVYLFIRFGLGEILKRYTVHRGMWHSIPAALTAAMIAALIVSGTDFEQRFFKVVAVLLGYLTHLTLDEIYSIEMRRGRLRLKKSFGTALKFWSGSRWANVSTYAKLILFGALALGDPVFMEHFGQPESDVHRIAREAFESVLQTGEDGTIRR
jgi:membrane-bound metal-dependent hydrolase YbcI (DUF457 family)